MNGGKGALQLLINAMGKFTLLKYLSELRLRVSSFDYRKVDVESLRRTGHL